jgi:hypothetical protein
LPPLTFLIVFPPQRHCGHFSRESIEARSLNPSRSRSLPPRIPLYGMRPFISQSQSRAILEFSSRNVHIAACDTTCSVIRSRMRQERYFNKPVRRLRVALFRPRTAPKFDCNAAMSHIRVRGTCDIIAYRDCIGKKRESKCLIRDDTLHLAHAREILFPCDALIFTIIPRYFIQRSALRAAALYQDVCRSEVLICITTRRD